ncbi:hypothetical protein KUW17_20265 [Leisingera aquaemixtae]|uniref:hypothetical protein n=1 Tax=Leisingera aquaemixtae TaxID=1396826 RepID=UPI001C96CD23|nr:hypothetical protein [Leisingera aquaemixtae]MBY6069089.1 hypothetical protein [Leisingera aquaemixtae]
MNAMDMPAALPALDHLRGQAAALAEAAPRDVRAGHLDLGEGLWLSCDPGGHARMSAGPGQDGFTLGLEGGDSGRWACLGLKLQPAELAQARYAGLRLALRSGSLIACSPALRYFLPEGGLRDVPAAAPLLLAPGAREVLVHLPVDRELAARASACELNIFFLDDSFRADAVQIEPLLMV